MIRLAKCERAIRLLYHTGESLPLYERYPFRDPMEVILSKSVCAQERWVSMTEDYLPAARRWVKEQTQKRQHSFKEFFGQRFLQRILWSAFHSLNFSVRWSGFFPSHLTSRFTKIAVGACWSLLLLFCPFPFKAGDS
jgi:hypothetical protein